MMMMMNTRRLRHSARILIIHIFFKSKNGDNFIFNWAFNMFIGRRRRCLLEGEKN